MKRVGYFFSSFLPFLIAMGAQMLAMCFLTGTMALFVLWGSYPTDELYSVLTSADFSTCIMVLYSVICIVVFALWYYHSCGGNYLPNVSQTFHPLQLVSIVLLVPGMQFFSSYLIGIVSTVFPAWLSQYEELIETAGLGSDITPLMFCYSVMLAPIGEELIFRGVTLRQARKAVPFWLANLLQAFLFGVYHMNWIQGIYAFALGLVLGYVCEKGGSIYYSMLFHVLFNFWGTVIGQLIGDIDDTGTAGLLLFVITVALLSIGGSLFSVGARLKAKKVSQSGYYRPGEHE